MRNHSPDHDNHSPVDYLPDHEYQNHYIPESSHTKHSALPDYPLPAQHSVTPVYWSASQLLTVPESDQQPTTTNMDCYHNQSYSYLSYDNHRTNDIPEEFCVTVRNLERQDSYFDRTGGKIPPPVLPKPRNITEV